MARIIHDITQYRFTESDQLFFDTNVWLCLHGKRKFRPPQMDDYIHAFTRINEAGSQIYVDWTVLSEFIYVSTNEALKVSERFYDPKAFRQSSEFAEAARQIDEYVAAILSRCRYIDSGFNNPRAIRELLTAYEAGRMDFSDHIIARACAAHNLIFVSNDADFAHQNLPLLTANPHSLKTRK